MHGKNRVRPRESNGEDKLQVQDIWYTIQGEGPFFGCPAVFIRLTGCNLRCYFCDTVWDDQNDHYLPVEDIVEKVKAISGPTNLVVLTGGEPCRQDLANLIDELLAHAYRVQVETAGTYWQECLAWNGVTIVCSPKTKHVHPKFREHCKDWKYVIDFRYVNIYDGLPAGCTQEIDVQLIKSVVAPDLFQNALDENPYLIETDRTKGLGLYAMVAGGKKFDAPARPPEGIATVWLSPCDTGDEYTKENILKVGELCLKYGYRAQVQLHKILGVP